MTREEVLERLKGLSGTIRTTAALLHEGWTTAEAAEFYGVVPETIRQRVRKAQRVLGITRAEWETFLRDHGQLLAPCLVPSDPARADGTPCPRIRGAAQCAACDELAERNRELLGRDCPPLADGVSD